MKKCALITVLQDGPMNFPGVGFIGPFDSPEEARTARKDKGLSTKIWKVVEMDPEVNPEELFI